METKVVKWRSNEGVRSALLVNEGHKFVSLIPVDFPVRIRKVPLVETRHMSECEYKGKPYPVKRAVKVLKRMGKAYGITKAASKALGAA